MASPLSILASLLLLLVLPSNSQSNPSSEQHISVEISNNGLDFAKNLLIETAESSLVPLELPEINKSMSIPVVGTVEMVLSDIVIDRIDVNSSTVRTGNSCIIMSVSGATGNMGMKWRYSYDTWLLPVTVTDEGEASVQVEGMEMALTLSLQNKNGSLSLTLLECGCFVEDISVTLDGGASWLYQGLLDAFEGKLISTVEDAITKKIGDGVLKLDSALRSLPKEMKITKVASMNVTFVGDPVISNSSVSLGIDGLLVGADENRRLHHGNHSPLVSCKDSNEMVTMFLHEDVIKSALSVYFKAHKMQWVVDEVPDQSLLNTAVWRFVVPKLYKQYPNDDMTLNIIVTSTPSVEIEEQQMYAAIPFDIVINVKHQGEIVPVACISMDMSGWVFATALNGSVAGSVKLDRIIMSLKWSNIGNLHLFLVQKVAATVLRSVVVPLVNSRLEMGFRLPSFHGYELRDAGIFFADSWISVCGDVASVKKVLPKDWHDFTAAAKTYIVK